MRTLRETGSSPEADTIDSNRSDLEPAATARTLLEAYYLQDEREGCLLLGKPREAAAAAAKALDRMATTYEVEFPHVDRCRARRAGESFMRALFVQDEIENWELLRREARSDLSDVLVSDPSASYGSNPAADVRWGLVKTYLREACERTGIDERYAEKQMEFWLLHGQLDEYWEELALEAHEYKLRAMIEDPPNEVVERTGERFVDGVRIHDGWSHRNESDDLREAVELVAEYYREVFKLRSND